MLQQNQNHAPLSPKPSDDDVSWETQTEIFPIMSDETLEPEDEEQIVNSQPAFVQGVKIDPAKLQLLNTFEGKQFVRTVVIQNYGKNPAFVQYDSSRNHPYSELSITVEVSSLEEGDFKAEFTIRCVRQIKVMVTGNVMVGKLEVCNVPSCDDFTLIEFPKTYYDTKCTQRLVVRNNSVARTVFCVLFNDDENAEKEHNKCFSISPMDGRLEPREAKIFTIEYKPTRVHKVVGFHFAVLTIKKLNFWKDMNVTDYPRSDNSYISNQEIFMNHLHMDLEYRLKVCLHGEPEMVNVSCAPDELNIQNLIINNPVDRVLCIANNSKCLNIQFAYEKVAYINILPKGGTLQPNTSIETKVTLSVGNLGKITTNILFLLFHNNSAIDGIDKRIQVGKIIVPVTLQAKYQTKKEGVRINTGIAPTYIKEVGKNADLVAYNNLEVAIPIQTIDAPMRKQRKNDTAFIAFPNDRSKSLRPWTLNANPIQTIYAKIPRGIVHNTSLNNIKTELTIRDQTREYYANYLKHSRMHLLKLLYNNELPDYEITKTKQCLLYRYFSDIVVTPNEGIIHSFIPLTPLQLNRIIVTPVYIGVGLMAPYSKTSKSFSITNDNDLSIRVYIIPEKQRFTFPSGEAMIVKSNSTKNVDFIFFSESEGNHSLCIRIVVNECHIFEVTVYANVIHKQLYKSSKYLTFNPDDPPYKYMSLYNPLNVDIDFNWLPSDSNFIVEPAKGKIPPLKAMSCLVTYDPLRNKMNTANLCFQTTPVYKQQFEASAGLVEINTSLCEMEVNFGSVPMNIKHRKQAVLWNLSKCTIYFSISKPTCMSGLRITPEKGFLKTKTAQIFSVNLKTLDCVPFKYVITVKINEKTTHELTILGNVIFPVVNYSPNPYKLKKFPVTSYARFAINIENKTKAPVFISFDFHLHMNCFISEYRDTERFRKAKLTLEANRNKLLYVCFEPKDVTSLWFNMPFVLNNILGPPTGTFAVASKTYTYLQNQCVKVNPSISILRVFTIICKSDFAVSKDYFKFFYHPYDLLRNDCEDKTTFTNTSEKVLEFCMRLDSLLLPFGMFYESGVDVKTNASSITFTLQPGDYTTLAVIFTPEHHGSFSGSVPFFVRNDYQDAVHNYLRFFAVYELPIITLPDTIYLEFIPLKFKLEKSFFVYLKNHSSGCILTASCDNDNLQILARSKSCIDSPGKYEICIYYTSTCCESFKSNIKFTCTCGSFADIVCVGVSENSLFSTFKIVRKANERIIISQCTSKQSDQTICDDTISHIMANDLNTFPYFPEDGENDYQISLDTLHALESWMFCQAFFGKLKFKIPDNFSIMMPLPNDEDDPKKCWTKPLKYVIPYIELLKQIASPEIAEQIGITISYTSEKELANELFCLYARVLNFLTEMDARLPHVVPELLLEYDLYVTYITEIRNDHTKLAQQPYHQTIYNFYLLSKQAWLDVILQTLKIFVVGRIKIMKNFNPPTKLVSKTTVVVQQGNNSSTLRQNSSNQVVVRSTGHHIFSTIEIYLLNWIKYYYMTYIGELCEQNLDVLTEKQIDDYDSCFMDSLALATLIVGHCPYLKYGLSNMYWIPCSTEQLHHNAATIVQALSLINSTFELLPRNIYNSNNVQMMLLVAYLYEFLPHLTPSNTISVTSKLSTTSSIKISIFNDNNFDVTYKVLFFENEHCCFTESRSFVNVPAKSMEYLCVKFQAKYIKLVTAVLVLCGEILDKKCAKSMAYRLIGEPNVTHSTSSFYVSAMYYTSKEHALDVQAPYKASGCYDLYITYNEPTSYQNLKLIDYFTINRDRLLFKFNLNTSQAFFNEEGKSTLYMNCVALTGRMRRVCIVQKKDTKQMFAMKYMNKHQCIERDALKNVLREVDILTRLEHPFLVNIWFSFQDEEDLFVVTDLLLGGDLRYHISQEVHFSENAIKLTICELASALDYLQSQKIIHRDIKPDNILLDEEGHAHITDFNIATVLENNLLATSMSGTKPYIAPEIFDCAVDICVGYSYPVDWWSLGIVAYEMLRGRRPYDIHSNTTIDDVMMLFNILPEYPSGWSLDIVDLISRLLCISPGARVSSLAEIRQVKCLRKYDMNLVHQRKYKPHFAPPKDHLNCDPTFELEEMIIETKPLHKKKKRLAKQRSINQIQGTMSLDMPDVDSPSSGNSAIASISSHHPDPLQLTIIPDFRIYNRYQELERRERERKETAWEDELQLAMRNSNPLAELEEEDTVTVSAGKNKAEATGGAACHRTTSVDLQVESKASSTVHSSSCPKLDLQTVINTNTPISSPKLKKMTLFRTKSTNNSNGKSQDQANSSATDSSSNSGSSYLRVSLKKESNSPNSNSRFGLLENKMQNIDFIDRTPSPHDKAT